MEWGRLAETCEMTAAACLVNELDRQLNMTNLLATPNTLYCATPARMQVNDLLGTDEGAR